MISTINERLESNARMTGCAQQTLETLERINEQTSSMSHQDAQLLTRTLIAGFREWISFSIKSFEVESAHLQASLLQIERQRLVVVPKLV